jgi:hypothetical protein
MTTGLRQLVDNRERMFEQIKLETHHPPSLLPQTPLTLSSPTSFSSPGGSPRLGMLQPLHHFLEQELEQVKTTQKTYHKAKADALHVVEKLSQCKRHEITGMSEVIFCIVLYTYSPYLYIPS